MAVGQTRWKLIPGSEKEYSFSSYPFPLLALPSHPCVPHMPLPASTFPTAVPVLGIEKVRNMAGMAGLPVAAAAEEPRSLGQKLPLWVAGDEPWQQSHMHLWHHRLKSVHRGEYYSSISIRVPTQNNYCCCSLLCRHPKIWEYPLNSMVLSIKAPFYIARTAG